MVTHLSIHGDQVRPTDVRPKSCQPEARVEGLRPRNELNYGAAGTRQGGYNLLRQ
jgi:hypothetical protein